MNWLFKTLLANRVPTTFRVVISLYETEEAAQQLANRRLEGVVGISASGTIGLQWLGVARDAMLAMPGPETLQLNSISEIRYDDPEYLMQNNMSALYRIFNQKGVERVLSNIFQYAVAAAKQSRNKDFAQFVYFSEWCAFWQKLSWYAEKNPPQVNSVQELAEWAAEHAPIAAERVEKGDWARDSATLTPDQWQYLLHGALKNVSRVYSDEGEWIVEGNVLNIPPGSVLYIMTYDVPEDILAEWNSSDPAGRQRLQFMGWTGTLERLDQLQDVVKKYGLDRIYPIRWVSEQGFKERRNDYFQRRDNQTEQ